MGKGSCCQANLQGPRDKKRKPTLQSCPLISTPIAQKKSLKKKKKANSHIVLITQGHHLEILIYQSTDLFQSLAVPPSLLLNKQNYTDCTQIQ